MERLMLLDLADLAVVPGHDPSSFRVEHSDLGPLLSGVSAHAGGSLLWRVRAVDLLLSELRLPLPDGSAWVPVGLYDPHTFEVAVGPLPGTAAFAGSGPVVFSAPAVPAELSGSAPARRLTVSRRVLREVVPSHARASRLVRA